MELKKSFLEKYRAMITEKIMVFKCITKPKSGKSQNKITAKRTLTRTSSSYYVKVQKKPVSKTNSIGFWTPTLQLATPTQKFWHFESVPWIIFSNLLNGLLNKSSFSVIFFLIHSMVTRILNFSPGWKSDGYWQSVRFLELSSASILFMFR